ncbi:hypothetical protein [Streptomyces bikiniensis]|uniref:hypothetical protein n=1 Tax=Streptomyces bikiniensis TaxID=1896 RepID=UPI000AD476D0|nr:hypothetical protein [Streptomyces bikiniensis]
MKRREEPLVDPAMLQNRRLGGVQNAVTNLGASLGTALVALFSTRRVPVTQPGSTGP